APNVVPGSAPRSSRTRSSRCESVQTPANLPAPPHAASFLTLTLSPHGGEEILRALSFVISCADHFLSRNSSNQFRTICILGLPGPGPEEASSAFRNIRNLPSGATS